jgi:hypothetical protein
VTIPTTGDFTHQSIMVVAFFLPPSWGAYNNQQTLCDRTMLLKLEKLIIIGFSTATG